MFRRLWSGLPRDVCFPADLADLGYFINEEDEIRSIEDPNNYFKYFLNRNDRVNRCQRFALDQAVEAIIHERLLDEGLEKLRIPLGKSAKKPHTPIFVSPDLEEKSRVVVVFGECTKDLGMLACSVVEGPGGIDEGSMVSLVRGLKEQACSSEDDAAPGIVLANMGQLHWWPQGGRAITTRSSNAVHLPSLVHAGRKFYPEVNGIPLNADQAMHVSYIFNDVLYMLASKSVKIDIVAVGDACEIVQRFLDDPQNWAIWGEQLNAMVLVEPVMARELLSNDGFKEFLAKRARGYLASPEPLDTPLASLGGNPYIMIPALGCPCFSSSETLFIERILVKTRSQVLQYLDQLARDQDFENPILTIALPPEYKTMGMDDFWASLPEDQKPKLNLVEPEVMREHARQVNQWEDPESLEMMGGQSDPWDDSESIATAMGTHSSWGEEPDGELPLPVMGQESTNFSEPKRIKLGVDRARDSLEEYEDESGVTVGSTCSSSMTSEKAYSYIQ